MNKNKSSSSHTPYKKQVENKQVCSTSEIISKKNPINNPQKIQHAKISKINMETVFEANKQYLMDKIAISQIPRPSKYYHKIPSKTPNSTYNNQFHKAQKDPIIQLKLQRKDNLYSSKDNIIGYQSLYSQNYNQKQKSKSLASTSKKQSSQQKERNAYHPNDAPNFLQTSYHFNFQGNYNPVPAQSAKRGECKLMGGGKFQGNSTYYGVFKSYEMKRQKPILQKNNKIFMSINAPKQSTYEKQFNTIQTTKSSKSKASQFESEQKSARKRVSSEMIETYKHLQKKKMSSEYERSFQTVQGSSLKNKNISLMSLQEMRNLILNVL